MSLGGRPPAASPFPFQPQQCGRGTQQGPQLPQGFRRTTRDCSAVPAPAPAVTQRLLPAPMAGSAISPQPLPLLHRAVTRPTPPPPHPVCNIAQAFRAAPHLTATDQEYRNTARQTPGCAFYFPAHKPKAFHPDFRPPARLTSSALDAAPSALCSFLSAAVSLRGDAAPPVFMQFLSGRPRPRTLTCPSASQNSPKPKTPVERSTCLRSSAVSFPGARGVPSSSRQAPAPQKPPNFGGRGWIWRCGETNPATDWKLGTDWCSSKEGGCRLADREENSGRFERCRALIGAR